MITRSRAKLNQTKTSEKARRGLSHFALACALIWACGDDKLAQRAEGDWHMDGDGDAERNDADGDGDGIGDGDDYSDGDKDEQTDAAVVGDGDGDTDVGPAPLDPGTMQWELVPEDQVRETCKLDPDALKAADQMLNVPWAVVRYGKLCHQFRADGMAAGPAWSVTKTLGALVTGIVAYETRNLEPHGRKTGPLTDEDRVDHWLDNFSYNKDARIAHVLAMVAHSSNLTGSQMDMAYDTIGTTQINSLSDILNTAIDQDKTRLGADLEEFTQKFLFKKLGLAKSDWGGSGANKTFAYSWETDVYDMAKVGLLMLRGGSWNGERILAADWVYRMTHPSFEAANTAYGYLTWLNAANNYDYGGIPFAPLPQAGPMLGDCAPFALWKSYPHGLSAASGCNYGPPYSCTQKFDVGVWQAVGLGGQVIQGHPGLDLVLVAKDLTPLGTGPEAPSLLWNAVKSAVIEADPMFAGDGAAFCKAYGSNSYAPDLAP